MKEIIVDNKDILLQLEKLERKTIKHDHSFKVVFAYLRELLNPPKPPPMQAIGFRQRGSK